MKGAIKDLFFFFWAKDDCIGRLSDLMIRLGAIASSQSHHKVKPLSEIECSVVLETGNLAILWPLFTRLKHATIKARQIG